MSNIEKEILEVLWNLSLFYLLYQYQDHHQYLYDVIIILFLLNSNQTHYSKLQTDKDNKTFIN